jgi:hypothetical protein
VQRDWNGDSVAGYLCLTLTGLNEETEYVVFQTKGAEHAAVEEWVSPVDLRWQRMFVDSCSADCSPDFHSHFRLWIPSPQCVAKTAMIYTIDPTTPFPRRCGLKEGESGNPARAAERADCQAYWLDRLWRRDKPDSAAIVSEIYG